MIAMDGEGSKKFIEVNVCGAWNKKDARRVAKKIAGSDLVKAAIAGGWPNWGRILAAAGSASARINLSKLRLKIGPYTVYDITPLPINEPDIKEYLSKNEITIWMELANGHESATAWSCDLTEEYVRINMKKE
jgi:glutamate N-acetyltransferase/amino-acid N-acetyltransferase